MKSENLGYSFITSIIQYSEKASRAEDKDMKDSGSGPRELVIICV